MIKQQEIIEYACRNSPFSYSDIKSKFCIKPNEHNSLSTQLNRLVSAGKVEKKESMYSATENARRQFIPYFDEEMEKIENEIAKRLPLLPRCIWHSEDIRNLSHYAIYWDIIFVDVEKMGEEPVFDILCGLGIKDRRVLLLPSAKDYGRYISNHACIVVRNMVSQAPIKKYSNDSYRTTLEKILVDSVCDSDFISFQGLNSYYVFDNAMDWYDLNMKKLLRYAKRRNRGEDILDIIKEVKDGTFRE